MNIAINISEKALALRVQGDLLSTNAESVRGEINKIVESAEKTGTKWGLFELDLSSAKMVDSVGLNLVVTLLKRVQKSGAKMRVLYSSPNVARIFTFTRLDRHVELQSV